ncbi:hypothetical protein [Marmoricola sp. RAF53]|uniref:hypothetical protein n=1 Tax=Marmoricola sp. RAF53 TaxID=3233059 RepID=UPI003F963FF5
MDLSTQITQEAVVSWHPLERRTFLEHMRAVDPRLRITLLPIEQGLCIEVSRTEIDTESTCLPWPVSLQQAVLFVEDCAVRDSASRASHHWFRFWLRDRLEELNLHRDPTTACLAFGELLMRLEAGSSDHSIAVVGDEGARAVPRFFRSPSTDKLDTWTHRFHADARLEASVGWTEASALLRVGPAWVEATGDGAIVAFRTWETSWEELQEILLPT